MKIVKEDVNSITQKILNLNSTILNKNYNNLTKKDEERCAFIFYIIFLEARYCG